MISFIKGLHNFSGGDYIIVEVNGIGYKIFVPASVLFKLPPVGDMVTVHTYLHVREDAMQLYGFLDADDLEVFEILLQVSGIGPKGALAVLAALPAESFKQAILSEQLAVLTQIPGIGKKTAQRMVIELKDKLAKITGPGKVQAAATLPVANDQNEAVQALIALGYGANEAKRAVAKVASNEPDAIVEDIIRKSLLDLGKF